jgi:peptidoglycan/LPS O-acetylase OafA/YrhL
VGGNVSLQTGRTSGRLVEIDGLRALAVLAVVVNHFFEVVLPSGFLGVDVFFVISGYVITRQLNLSTAESWTEHLLTFYARRIKRLLPTLLLVVVVTTMGFLLLAPKPSAEVLKTGYYALFGASNVFLFVSSSNYFSIGAKLNSFTQTWSLGVEEQFYVVFPLLMWLAGYNGLRGRAKISIWKMLVILTMASFVAYLYFSSHASAAAFYLMPMRFWELSTGFASVTPVGASA